jgi:glutathione S-transferase|tara:strand:+ start:1126 stop:1407 length:282 start_codon:yes stop_codon:yes gene_type:complete
VLDFSRNQQKQAAYQAVNPKGSVPALITESEDDLLQGPWVHGDAYTICDPYLFAISSWLESDGVDTAALPHILAHRENMLARSATQDALSQLS